MNSELVDVKIDYSMLRYSLNSTWM